MRTISIILLLFAAFILGGLAVASAITPSKPMCKITDTEINETDLELQDIEHYWNERDSPKARIGKDRISVYDKFVRLDMEGVQWFTVAGTNSMDPVVDAGHYVLAVKPERDDLQPGDIVAYDPTPENASDPGVLHRISYISQDPEGWYAIVRGDNNEVDDGEKVRFGNIDLVVIGFLY